MNYIVNSLAAYEVHVARYYFRRGAYVAAANRAQQAVQEFQQSPATEEALFIMAQSYDKLGLIELRDDAERVLKQELPEQRVRRAHGPPEDAVVAALVSTARAGYRRRLVAAASSPSQASASASSSTRVIGGSAASRRRP